jgi:hypothetical protein
MSAAVKELKGNRPRLERAPPHSIDAEQAVLGGILTEHVTFDQIAERLDHDDFYVPVHQGIFRAMRQIIRDKGTLTLVSVSEMCKAMGVGLPGGGEVAYLADLGQANVGVVNALQYADEVKDRSIKRRALEFSDDAARSISNAETAPQLLAGLRSKLDSLERRAAGPNAKGIKLRHIAELVAERREPEWLKGLEDILERRVLAVLAGPRETFKSFIILNWCMTAALNGEPVMILSAEGAGLDRRIDAWMRTYAPAVDIATVPVYVFERALNLNSQAVLDELKAEIEASGIKPKLGAVDTFSKYAPGLEENSNAEVGEFLSRLALGLRDYFGMTLLLSAHTGHTEKGRPRGASVLMANPDAEYIVERPDPAGMAVTVSRERFKDSERLPPLAYIAKVVDLGRLDSRGKGVTSLVLVNTDPASIPSAPQRDAKSAGADLACTKLGFAIDDAMRRAAASGAVVVPFKRL